MASPVVQNPVVPIEVAHVRDLLWGLSGTTVASVDFEAPVAVAAANRGIDLIKKTRASVVLAGKIAEDTDVYLNRVSRTAEIEPAFFEKSEAWYTHDDDVYSIVRAKKDQREYLHLQINRRFDSYFLAGEEITAEQAASYCTPSQAKKILADTDAPIYNRKNDLEHRAIVRAVRLEHVTRIAARGRVISKYSTPADGAA